MILFQKIKMVDWPGFYPKEKLKKLPRIRELLKLDPISCLEEEQRLQKSMIIENLEDDIKIDAKNGDTTEEIISTDEEMTEIEPNIIKLIDDKSYLETEGKIRFYLIFWEQDVFVRFLCSKGG